MALDDGAAGSFWTRLNGFVRAYAFVVQVMPWTDTDLERLFLYGRLLLTELPAGDSDAVARISKSIQLTHVRIAIACEGLDRVGS